MGGGVLWECGQGRLVLRHELPHAAVPTSVGEPCQSSLHMCCIENADEVQRLQASSVTNGSARDVSELQCRALPARASQTVCGGGGGCGGSGAWRRLRTRPAAARQTVARLAARLCWALCSRARSFRCHMASTPPASSCWCACLPFLCPDPIKALYDDWLYHRTSTYIAMYAV